MNKEEIKAYKKAVGKIKCPMCQGQLDGNIHPSRSILECRSNPLEYTCTIYSQKLVPDYEKYSLFYVDFKYELVINDGWSRIDRYDLSFDIDKLYKSKKVLCKVPESLSSLFCQNPSQEYLLKKIEIYNIFS